MSNSVVALLFGGKSSEHEISIISAKAITAHIDKNKYTIFPLYISQCGQWFMGRTAREILDLDMSSMLKQHSLEETGHQLHNMTANRENDLFRFDFRQKGIDVAFPVLHGTYGEDGKVQGLLEIFGIPYTGCGVQASAITMDKAVTKICAAEAGLNVAEYITVSSSDYLSKPSAILTKVEEHFSLPFFVKPANLGSSVGISKVNDMDTLQESIETACCLDKKIIIEKAVNGREVEVALLGNENPIATCAGEIEPGSDFYDYTDKYINNAAKLHIPARIDGKIHASLKESAIKIYKTLGCSGMARADFFIEHDSGLLIFNEINTIPGFTGISMYPMLMENSGIGFTELIDNLLQLALEKIVS
ncbi:D-alanine--D-alanine ligase family protein [Prosthecochloris sp.]|uniref:D-alanine--D-alanine ligase family protein n=1 Tax=Prosthecochloris sp. TaxID=290513 RepID=UPI0025E7C5CE|nr:D-alanine--D-alanine ligase family protein [Prosthecochloris sp.]